MKILVTGASGMIGKALVNNLKNIRDKKVRITGIEISEVYECTRKTTDDEFEDYCSRADFVYNLAGINRPQDDEEYRIGNVDFVNHLVETLEKTGNIVPVMQSSSVQASNEGRYKDSIYGNTKRQSEEIIFEYSKNNSIPVYVFRLPNVMGHSKPYYNSAISTFCYAIANDKEYQVNDSSTMIEVVYIDDLVVDLINLLSKNCNTNANDMFAYVSQTYNVSLGYIVDVLKEFREQPNTLNIPRMKDDSFEKKLYSLFLTYLPKQDFKYQVKMNCDDRGSFTELLHFKDCGQVSVNVSEPGITKGQHWHNSKWEIFIVVSGHALIQMRNINTDESVEFEVSGEKIEPVYMIPGWTHNIINMDKKEKLVTLIYCNEVFNPNKPDTFFEEV